MLIASLCPNKFELCKQLRITHYALNKSLCDKFCLTYISYWYIINLINYVRNKASAVFSTSAKSLFSHFAVCPLNVFITPKLVLILRLYERFGYIFP